jgi:hypothetical protein
LPQQGEPGKQQGDPGKQQSAPTSQQGEPGKQQGDPGKQQSGNSQQGEPGKQQSSPRRQHHFWLTVVLHFTALEQQLAATSPQHDFLAATSPQHDFLATALTAKQHSWGGLQQGASGAQHEAATAVGVTVNGAAAVSADRLAAKATTAMPQVMSRVRMSLFSTKNVYVWIRLNTTD